MSYATVRDRLPSWLRRRLLFFETAIETEVAAFAASLPDRAAVLDAGAGEARHAQYFSRHRYVAADLAIGDSAWNYARLDVLADLEALPFASASFAAALNIVTLEHVRRPDVVLREIARVLEPGGRLLLIAPQEWEVHQAPHDYYRYTRYGLEWLLTQAGFGEFDIQPVGGYFHLLSRRLLNGLQFFSGVSFYIAALFLAPPALLAPYLDSFDRQRTFTLGYRCIARKR